MHRKGVVLIGGSAASALQRRAKRPSGLRCTALCIAIVAAGWAGLSRAAAATGVLPWPQNPDWQHYVEAPSATTVTPLRVVSTTGDVTNATGLTSGGNGQGTTLTLTQGGTAPVLVLDYGLDTGGLPTFDVTSVSGTPVLRAAYAEALHNLTTSGDGSIATVGAFMSGDPQRYDQYTITGAGVVTNQFIQGGERYQLLTLDQPGSVTLQSVGINVTAFRGTPSALTGHFISSDDLLNRIWYASVYTLNLNQVPPGVTGGFPGEVNTSSLIIDGAKRDRAVWSGDLGISGLTTFYADDPAYVRDSLALIGSHPATNAGELEPVAGAMAAPGPLPGVCSPNTQGGDGCLTWSASYSLVFVPELYQYYLYTGDLGFVEQQWPAVVRDLAWAAEQVDSNGLFTVNSGAAANGGSNDGQDWNLESTNGDLTYDNALYYMALLDAVKLEAALGSSAPVNPGCPTTGSAVACVEDYSAQAQALEAAVNAQLWNGSTGVYDASTAERGNFVQDANAFAVLSGLAGSARSNALMAVLDAAIAGPHGNYSVARPVPSSYTQTTSGYMSGFNLLADLQAGRTDAALALLRQEWGWMVTNDPGGTVWEKIESGGQLTSNGESSFSTSGAHGWSTGAAPALSAYVLGVQPTTPAFATFAVTPQPGDLSWAEGTAASPSGDVNVEWGASGVTTNPTGFAIQVSAPASTTATVAVPLYGATRVITEDGTEVWDGSQPVGGVSASTDGTYVYFAGATSSHLWEWGTLQPPPSVPETPWVPVLPLSLLAIALGVTAYRRRSHGAN